MIVPVYTKADANMIKSNVSGIEFHPVALNRVFQERHQGLIPYGRHTQYSAGMKPG